MSITLSSTHAAARSATGGAHRPSGGQRWPGYLDPDRRSDHVDSLDRAARAMSASPQDAEDLVQDAAASVLRRPRWLSTGNELGYLLGELRQMDANRYRAAQRRPQTRQLLDHEALASPAGSVNSREILEAVASAPAKYQDAAISVDLLGLSYREAARALNTSEATITTCLCRGHQRVALELVIETATAD